jgi:hypothetical protein
MALETCCFCPLKQPAKAKANNQSNRMGFISQGVAGVIFPNGLRARTGGELCHWVTNI